MSEIRSGIRSALAYPLIYDIFQTVSGGSSARREIVRKYIRPSPNMRLLDIGCGTAQILELLPQDIDYIGFDASEGYIKNARQRYGERGHFYQELVNTATLNDLGPVDLVLASGLLHHLQDNEVHQLSELAHQALRSGGRLLTIDPAYQDNQSSFARFMINRDRGQNVRKADEYQHLLGGDTDWASIHCDVRHDLLNFPYTHAVIECRK